MKVNLSIVKVPILGICQDLYDVVNGMLDFVSFSKKYGISLGSNDQIQIKRFS